MAVVELKVTANKVRGGLRRLGIEAGADEKYSTRDIFHAINELGPLELEARKARLEGTIDEAQFQRARRQEQAGRLIDISYLEQYVDDCQKTILGRIRHCSLPENEKRLLLDLLTHNVPGIQARIPSRNKKRHSTNGQDKT